MYPRLMQRYGRNCIKKDLIKPCRSDRSHAVVGTRTYEKYGLQLDYKKSWRNCLEARSNRLKPERDVTHLFKRPSQENTKLAAAETSMRENIAKSLLSLRQPQLQEVYSYVSKKGDNDSLLGEGREGVVRLVKRTEDTSDKLYAVKSINKIHSHLFREKDNPIKREVNVLRRMKAHPNIVRLLDVFESPIRLHMVTDYYEGGDLFNYECAKDFMQEEEEDVQRVVAALLSAVKFINSQDIVHLDIKLENILRRTNGDIIDSGGIVLIDFGHSKAMPDGNTPTSLANNVLSRPVGSPSYAAPEVVLNKKYNARSDMWSIGVLTYILLQGCLPFPQLQTKSWYEFTEDDYLCTLSELFTYDEDWGHLSPEAKDFLQGLLCFIPEERMSVDEANAHPWLKGNLHIACLQPSDQTFMKRDSAVVESNLLQEQHQREPLLTY